jgi:hypothetical protein
LVLFADQNRLPEASDYLSEHHLGVPAEDPSWVLEGGHDSVAEVSCYGVDTRGIRQVTLGGTFVEVGEQIQAAELGMTPWEGLQTSSDVSLIASSGGVSFHRGTKPSRPLVVGRLVLMETTVTASAPPSSSMLV